jgi:soluble lytic murein transglycosylase-like protein
MARVRITVVILAAGFWFSQPAPSRAQIASYIDGNGRIVYVNKDSPKKRSGSTISPPAGSTAGQSTAAAGNYGGLQAASLSADGSSNSTEDRLDRIVREAAERHKVDPALVKAVITTESGWNPQAVSRRGAVGLMQLIPQTAQRFGVNNSFDPAQNVEGGTTYLRSLLDRYNGDLPKSLAAYNAGEHAVDLSGGVPGYPETQMYVQKVTRAYFRPGSGRDPNLWSPPRRPVRQETDSNGRVVFTNQ